VNKIIIGTANFSNQYGIADSEKSLSKEDLKSLINWAQMNSLNHFDTALNYGKSEEILGDYLVQSLKPIVDTKLDANSCISRKTLLDTVQKMKDRLGVDQISTLYLHNEAVLQNSGAIEVTYGLNDVLDLGLAKQIGVSVYTEDAILSSKKAFPKLTVFQVPENICDRRLISSRIINELAYRDNSFIIRSIFLQGLLLMDPISIPANLNLARPSVRDLINFAKINTLSRYELCLAYANSIPWASGIIVGIRSLEQLIEIKRFSSSLPPGWDSEIAKLPPEVIDPRKWNP